MSIFLKYARSLEIQESISEPTEEQVLMQDAFRHRSSGQPAVMSLWRGKTKPPVELAVADLERHTEGVVLN